MGILNQISKPHKQLSNKMQSGSGIPIHGTTGVPVQQTLVHTTETVILPGTGTMPMQQAAPVTESLAEQYAKEALVRGVDPLGTHLQQYPQQTTGIPIQGTPIISQGNPGLIQGGTGLHQGQTDSNQSGVHNNAKTANNAIPQSLPMGGINVGHPGQTLPGQNVLGQQGGINVGHTGQTLPGQTLSGQNVTGQHMPGQI